MAFVGATVVTCVDGFWDCAVVGVTGEVRGDSVSKGGDLKAIIPAEY